MTPEPIAPIKGLYPSREHEENQVKETLDRIDDILRRLETLKEGL